MFFFHRFLWMMLRPTPTPPVPGIPGVSSIPCWRPSVAWDPNHESFLAIEFFFFECLNGNIFGVSVINTTVHKVYIYSMCTSIWVYLHFSKAPFFHGELPSIFKQNVCVSGCTGASRPFAVQVLSRVEGGYFQTGRGNCCLFWSQKRFNTPLFFKSIFGTSPFTAPFLVFFFWMVFEKKVLTFW